MPSSSPRCAQFPRAQDKVHFYIKLKELRDQVKGVACSRDVLETQYSFDLQLAKGKLWLISVIITHLCSKRWHASSLHLFCRRGQEDRHQRGAGGSRIWKLQWATDWHLLLTGGGAEEEESVCRYWTHWWRSAGPASFVSYDFLVRLFVHYELIITHIFNNSHFHMSVLSRQLNSHRFCEKTSNTLQNGCVCSNSVLGILLWRRKEW